MTTCSFLDDYSEGAHPDILRALVETNLVRQTAYGEDDCSADAASRIASRLGPTFQGAIHFVAIGTMANIVSIASCLRPHEAVIAVGSGHIVVREAGAICSPHWHVTRTDRRGRTATGSTAVHAPSAAAGQSRPVQSGRTWPVASAISALTASRLATCLRTWAPASDADMMFAPSRRKCPDMFRRMTPSSRHFSSWPTSGGLGEHRSGRRRDGIPACRANGATSRCPWRRRWHREQRRTDGID